MEFLMECHGMPLNDMEFFMEYKINEDIDLFDACYHVVKTLLILPFINFRLICKKKT